MGSYEQISAFTAKYFVLSIEIFVNLLDEVKEDLKVVKSSEDQNGIVELEFFIIFEYFNYFETGGDYEGWYFESTKVFIHWWSRSQTLSS